MANVYIFVYGQCFHPKKNLITTKALKCGIDSDKARKNQVYVAKTLPVQKEAGKLKAIELSVEKINLCHFLQKKYFFQAGAVGPVYFVESIVNMILCFDQLFRAKVTNYAHGLTLILHLSGQVV